MEEFHGHGHFRPTSQWDRESHKVDQQLRDLEADGKTNSVEYRSALNYQAMIKSHIRQEVAQLTKDPTTIILNND